MRIILSLFSASLLFICAYSFADTAPMPAMDMGHYHQTTTAVQTYGSEGVITQWQSDRVGISHQAIPALKWPAMTMNFRLPPDIAAHSLPAGTPVVFSFVKTDNAYQLVTLTPQKR
ncbi:copper-binding protein [Rahnella woolbedingensis]|uniref:Copper-binding protein n=1 Tax=Rahnella woolbedingensis TaxID=1510574 RepID=A0A419NES6_9GAMM|nr:copper-binding protein [Rahnella woolbedingensis]RJT47264.1 hypothetical protein D6C13_01870 [Rahnella woolbedingensis]